MGFSSKPAARPSRVPGAMNMAVRLDSVTKVYGRGDGAVIAMNDVSGSIARGTFTAVMGPLPSESRTYADQPMPGPAPPGIG